MSSLNKGEPMERVVSLEEAKELLEDGEIIYAKDWATTPDYDGSYNYPIESLESYYDHEDILEDAVFIVFE